MLAKKKGAIVNIGSAAGTIPDPLYSVYSGSKALVRAASCQLLRSEFCIVCVCLMLYGVSLVKVEFFSTSMAAELGGRSSITCQDHIPFL